MPSTGIIIGIAVVLGVVIIGLGMGGPGKKEEESIEDRLAQLGTLEKPPSLEDIELSLPFTERVLRPRLRDLAEYISKFTPDQTLTRTRRKLELAGVSRRIGATEFLAIRYVLTAVFGIGAIVFAATSDMEMIKRLGAIPVLAALGNFLPVLMLGSRISSRQKEIVKALPDVMDLLTICVEAGLGFNAAMSKVVDKWDNELTHAFGRVLQEIQLGKTRREALRGMADMMDVSDVSTFVAAIVQADALGVSIAKVLRIQSDQLRVRRRQRAEEAARKAPVMIALPTVLLIFPALLVIILGPAVLLLMEIFQGVNIGL
ncbi:MAG: type II secretion system F family protein [Anaerolineae bacterium]|nr:type II secretion system F family protein [Anaerolineae bacterium]